MTRHTCPWLDGSTGGRQVPRDLWVIAMRHYYTPNRWLSVGRASDTAAQLAKWKALDRPCRARPWKVFSGPLKVNLPGW